MYVRISTDVIPVLKAQKYISDSGKKD